MKALENRSLFSRQTFANSFDCVVLDTLASVDRTAPLPTLFVIHAVLSNPVYAGAYAYG
jgi:hypothetical protein